MPSIEPHASSNCARRHPRACRGPFWQVADEACVQHCHVGLRYAVSFAFVVQRRWGAGPVPEDVEPAVDVVERLSVKLLSQCTREMTAMISECLCQEPNRDMIALMLKDVRSMLEEFEQAYFDR